MCEWMNSSKLSEILIFSFSDVSGYYRSKLPHSSRNISRLFSHSDTKRGPQQHRI